jgi:ABC-type glucose/galactose transport system permease subunit
MKKIIIEYALKTPMVGAMMYGLEYSGCNIYFQFIFGTIFIVLYGLGDDHARNN